MDRSSNPNQNSLHISSKDKSKCIQFLYFILLILPTFTSGSKYYGGILLQASKEDGTISAGWWDTWQKCNEGSFVRGLRVRIEKGGISGIILYCSRKEVSSISQLFKLFPANEGGIWSRIHFCHEGPAIGFQMKMEENSNQPLNIQLICSSNSGAQMGMTQALDFRENGQGNRDQFQRIGLGKVKSNWRRSVNCYKRHALCGIQPKFFRNNTGELHISDMRMSCCQILPQAEICTPKDKWELLFEYDNRQGINPVKYSYIKKVGIGRIGGNKKNLKKLLSRRIIKSGSDEEEEEDPSKYFKTLKERFGDVIGHSFTTGFDWNQAASDTWTEERSFPIDVEIKPGSYTKVYQITGICGDWRVRPNKIYQKGVLRDMLRLPQDNDNMMPMKTTLQSGEEEEEEDMEVEMPLLTIKKPKKKGKSRGKTNEMDDPNQNGLAMIMSQQMTPPPPTSSSISEEITLLREQIRQLHSHISMGQVAQQGASEGQGQIGQPDTGMQTQRNPPRIFLGDRTPLSIILTFLMGVFLYLT